MSIDDSKTSSTRKQLLGQILLNRGNITESQLNHSLEIQEKKGGLIGVVLVDLGYVSEQAIVSALVVQCHVPYIAIDQYDIDRTTLKLIPSEIAHKYHVVPLDQVNKILSIVMADPLDMEAKHELQNITNCRLVPFIATHGEIDKAIHRWYDMDEQHTS
jgi:type IV pilus assembly protein PilB